MLSGGQSRRFGQDKAALRHPDGRSLLERGCALAAALPARVVVVGPAPPAGVAHATDPGCGPLAALAAAHRAFPAAAGALWLPVDLPCLDAAALQALAAPLPPGVALRVGAGTDGAAGPAVPLPGRVGPAAIARLLAADAAGERSLARALHGLPAAWLGPAGLRAAGADPRALTDADTPDGWAALLGAPPAPPTR